MGPLRVLVVDDNPTLLRSVGRLLASMSDVEVVGEAASGRAALDMAAQLRPDLVLMDLTMPEMDGLEAARRLSARPGAPTIIMMTVHDLQEYREAARAAGTYALLTKSDLVERLQPMIRRLQLDRGRGGAGPA